MTGSRLLKRADVRRQLDAVISKHLDELDDRAGRVLRAVEIAAHADVADLVNPDGTPRGLRQIPKRLRLAINGVRPGKYGTEYKLADKLAAQKLLMQYHHMIREVGNEDDPLVVKILKVTKADLEKE